MNKAKNKNLMKIVGRMAVPYLILNLAACSSSNNVYKLSTSKLKRKDHLKTKGIEAGPSDPRENASFKDMTSVYGLSGIKATNFYAVDFNRDGWTDLVILPNFYSVPEFYEYMPLKRKFQKISYNPLPARIKYSFLYFADLDKDGVLDLIGGNPQRKTEITAYPLDVYKGSINLKKASYKKIDDAFKRKPFGPSSITVMDFDLDGELDIFAGNWFDFKGKYKKSAPDALYKGKGFKFLNVSYLLDQEYNTRDRGRTYHNAAPTFGVSSCDINQDGWPDLLTTSSAGYSNKLWINKKTGKQERMFQDLGGQTQYASDDEGRMMPKGGGNSFFGACFDYNNDSIMDVFLGELSHPYDHSMKDRSSILTGSQVKFPFKFLRSEFYYTESDRNASRCDRRAVFLDYNIDGRIDMLVDNSGYPPHSRLILFRQNEDKSFDDVARMEGVNILNPTGTIRMDLNRDGMMDFITGQTTIRNAGIKKRIYAFQNQVKREKRKSIRFYLQGENANRDGIGSMIVLQTRHEVMRKWVNYAEGPFPSQNERGMLFGMDQGDFPILVKVRWPYKTVTGDGKIEALTRVYTFNRLKLDAHKDITLCENGKWLEGIRECD